MNHYCGVIVFEIKTRQGGKEVVFHVSVMWMIELELVAIMLGESGHLRL